MAKRATFRAGALLGLGLAAACADPNLVRLQMPDGGVQLRRDLGVGKEHATSVKVETTDATAAHEVVEADGHWAVKGDDAEHGGTEVIARFDRVTLAWPGADAAVEQAVAAAEVHLHIVTGGAASVEAPSVGHALADEVIAVLGDALARSFVVAPPKPVKRADNWTWAPPPGTTGDLEAAVDGYFRTKDRGEDVVQLDLGQRGRTTEGAATIDVRMKGRALFAAAGYVALYDATLDRGDGSTRRITVRTAAAK